MFDLRRSTFGAPFRWIGHRPCKILDPRLLRLAERASFSSCAVCASSQSSGERRSSQTL